MKYLKLNCSESTNATLWCNIEYEFGRINGLTLLFALTLILSAIGLLTNSLSLVIFYSFEKRRFFQFMKVIFFNSLFANISTLSISICIFVLNDFIYSYNGVLYFDNEMFIFIQRFLYANCYSMFNSLAGVYSVIVTYERILHFKKSWLFSNTSHLKILFSK